MESAFEASYKRLKARSKGKSIKYIDAIQHLISKPHIKLCMSAPETLERLEDLGKIAILGNKILID